MRLLITGAWRCTAEQLDAIGALGHDIVFMQNESDPLPIPAEAVEGVICNGLFLHHPIETFVNLHYMQLTSAGFDRVPMDYVQSHGIEIYNARGVYSIPMAEFALFGVLQLYKQGKFFAENQNRCAWEKHRGLQELYGKKVCIVGCGSVGTECAKRFGAFGCDVTGVDLYPREDSGYDRMIPLSALDTALSEADVLVLTLPLVEASRHLINAERLARLKPGAILVNIARGAVVDTAAMTLWLAAGKGAAVLDVFETEPLDPASQLWQMENVCITPHNSFVGDGNSHRLWNTIQGNLERLGK